MFFDRIHRVLGISANDNPCVVHHLDWPARAKIELDAAGFVFRAGHAWSPNVLELDKARSERTDPSVPPLVTSSDDVAADAPTISAGGTERGWSNWVGARDQRGLVLTAALVGLDFIFHGHRYGAVAEGLSLEHRPTTTSGAFSPSSRLGAIPEPQVEAARLDAIASAGAIDGSGHTLSLSSLQGLGDATSPVKPPLPDLVATPTSQHVSPVGATVPLKDAVDTIETALAEPSVPSATTSGALVRGTSGADLLVGTHGNDHLVGGEGNDILIAGQGDDILDGGEGVDRMVGGSGDDIFIVDDVHDQIVEEGNEGNDTVVVLAGQMQEFSLEHVDHVENLIVSARGEFTASGNDLDNVIIVMAGSSTLSGGAGEDALFSSESNDRLDGGTGGDLMAGGQGDDRYVVDDILDEIVEELGQGNDTVETTLSEYRTQSGVENLVYVGSADFIGYGNDGANAIWGGDGDDWLYGEFDDWRGDTSALVPTAPALAPPPSVDAAAPDTTHRDLVEAALKEVLGTRQDLIVLAVIDAPETDQLQSVLLGSRSNDVLSGVAWADDAIDGGKGNDVIDGGKGNDVLTGGLGHDTFVFRPGFGNDTITDFTATGGGRDLISISAELFADFDAIESIIEQVGADVVIQITSSDRITLLNFEKIHLSANDHFEFY